jgi:hypothetical protein
MRKGKNKEKKIGEGGGGGECSDRGYIQYMKLGKKKLSAVKFSRLCATSRLKIWRD